MATESTTSTFKVDATVYHDLQMLKEKTKIPIRVIVDLLGELAVAALAVRVRPDWNAPQEVHAPNTGAKIVHMSNPVYKRLKNLTEQIGLNPTTAVNEAFYAKRSDINRLKGIRLESLNQCWNATCETARNVQSAKNTVIQAQSAVQ